MKHNSAYGCFRVVSLLPHNSVSKELPACGTVWVHPVGTHKVFFCTTKPVLQKVPSSVSQKNRKSLFSENFWTMLYLYHKEGKISIWKFCKSCKQLTTWTCHGKFRRHLPTMHWLLKFQYLKESNLFLLCKISRQLFSASAQHWMASLMLNTV